MEDNNHLHFLMEEVSRIYFARNFKLFEKIEIHPGQVPLLMTIRFNDGLSQKELANSLYVSPPTVAVSLKRMEKVGLIKKQDDEHDMRVTRVYITEKGIDTVEKIREVTDEIEQETFAGFSIEEKLLFKRLLMQIKDNLFKVSDEADLMKERSPFKERGKHRHD